MGRLAKLAEKRSEKTRYATPGTRPVGVIYLLLGLSACGDGVSTWGDGHADPRDTEKVALGRNLYAEHCAAGLGVQLEGQPEWRERLPNGRLPAPPHDESGHTWHHPDQVLFSITKRGLVAPHAPAGYESDMPAFDGKLGDEEIWAVLAYIKSHWRSREVLSARQQMTRDAKP